MLWKHLLHCRARVTRSVHYSCSNMVGNKSSRQPAWQKKPPLTHFLCLPLVTEASQPQLSRALKQFNENVCSNTSKESDDQSEIAAAKIHPKSIRPVGALHLTLGVMSLNEDQLAKAKELLGSLDIPALFKQSSSSRLHSDSDVEQDTAVTALTVDLKGLESMHNPESTSILYAAPTDPSGRLHSFCLALEKTFTDFLVPDDRPLRLHATIVNTIYAKGKKPVSRGGDRSSDDRSQGHGPNAKGSHKMDARPILEKYQDYVWAEDFKLDRVAICEMGAKKILDAAKVHVLDERYTEVAHASLPA